jgi:signal transduction histidine kinase
MATSARAEKPLAAARGSLKKKRPVAAGGGSAESTRSGRPPGLIVGIGASAGGLEALKKFFGAMPMDTGLVFVVVVHLDPAHRSFMVQLLSQVTGLTVEQAHDFQRLAADHVYVIPPKRSLAVDRGFIRVQKLADPRGLHGSIDHFFCSLAEAEGPHAVAIVLSGTGTEGTLGARAIKAGGGLVMAQEPETAAQSGMASHAIAAGVVDAVLPPEKMPEALLGYARSTRANGLAGVPAGEPLEQQVQGVALTLGDASALKQAERELYAARALLADDLRRMTRLHELGGRLAVSGDLHASLEDILRAATEITDAQMGDIQQHDPAAGLSIAAHLGLGQEFLDYFARVGQHGDSACAHAMSSQRRMLVEDVATSPVFADSPSQQVLLAAGARAVQSTPLLDRSGQFLGVFSTHYRTPHHFGEEELRWIDLLARHASAALERWRADESLRRSRDNLERQVADRTRWLTLLHELSDSISDAPTWDSALQRLLARLCALEEWQIGYVYLPDSEAPNVIAPALGCISDERFRPFHEVSERQRYARGESLPGRVYAQGVAKYSADSEELLQAMPIRSAAARQVGLQAGFAHAITAGREVIAVLELFSDRVLDRSEWFDNLLPAVADHIGRILERERSMGRMADLVWREQQSLLHTLHDSLGQTLTGLGMLSAGLRQRLTAAHGDAADTAAEIAKQAQHALEQVRQLSRSLFPIEVDASSLTSALRELAFATQSLHKIEVHVQGEVPEAFTDGAAAAQLYRIAQEAVTNAVKHARARSISIHVGRHASTLRLRIADDGIGIGKAAAGTGIGLQIMRYRAHSIGGILIVEPGSQGGTVVTCTLRTVPARKAARAPALQDSTTRTGSTGD